MSLTPFQPFVPSTIGERINSTLAMEASSPSILSDLHHDHVHAHAQFLSLLGMLQAVDAPLECVCQGLPLLIVLDAIVLPYKLREPGC